MKWITRERARVDRIACPWLISRFIDPTPEFLFVPANQVLEAGKRERAIPYDVPNVELGHHGPRCSFDAFIDRYELADPALALLAPIVRGADLHPEALHHLGLERVGQHRDPEPALGAAERHGERALVRPVRPEELHRLIAVETQELHGGLILEQARAHVDDASGSRACPARDRARPRAHGRLDNAMKLMFHGET